MQITKSVPMLHVYGVWGGKERYSIECRWTKALTCRRGGRREIGIGPGGCVFGATFTSGRKDTKRPGSGRRHVTGVIGTLLQSDDDSGEQGMATWINFLKLLSDVLHIEKLGMAALYVKIYSSCDAVVRGDAAGERHGL